MRLATIRTATGTRAVRLDGTGPGDTAVETGDAPTVQPLADEYAREMRADILVLTSPRGELLGAAGETVADLPRIIERAGTDEVSTFLPHGRGQVSPARPGDDQSEPDRRRCARDAHSAHLDGRDLL